MLDEATRSAILTLRANGHGSRKIAQSLGVARSTVRRVLSSGHAQVPALARAEAADPWRETILELQARFEGHLGRVHDELLKRGATLSYPALTGWRAVLELLVRGNHTALAAQVRRFENRMPPIRTDQEFIAEQLTKVRTQRPERTLEMPQ